VAVLDDRQHRREDRHLSGEVDVAVAGTVGAKLLTIASGTRGATVELDCVDLTFIDASGITMLLDVANCSGKQVRLLNLVTGCRRVFEVLDLCDQFGIERHTTRGPQIRGALSA
jgi:anti-anti-sigma factor